MATPLLRSSRSSKVPQAASSLAVPPEPPAEQAAAKDRLVHGSAGRHQLATLPSSSLRGATFDAAERGHVVGTSRQTLGRHDSESTRCMECCAKRFSHRFVGPDLIFFFCDCSFF